MVVEEGPNQKDPPIPLFTFACQDLRIARSLPPEKRTQYAYDLARAIGVPTVVCPLCLPPVVRVSV